MAENMSTTLAEQLGSYVAEESWADIPKDVRNRAKYCILDSVGVAMGGSQLELGQIMREFWVSQGGQPEATVFGRESLDRVPKLPVATASYVNSYLANLLDYDDTYSGRTIGHPGATIVPPALAVGECECSTGRDIVESVVLGYEVSIRIGEAIAPTPKQEKFVMGMHTWQIFGATVAASNLLNLSAEEIADALAIAAMHAPVPLQRKFGIQDGEIQGMKNNFGWASMGGVVAALLSAQGFSGNRQIFEGDRGFWRMAASDRFDSHRLVESLGDRYYISQVAFKPYSACRWTHAALDCTRQIIEEIGQENVDSILKIDVRTFYEAAKLDSFPTSISEAPFSLPYVIAMILADNEPGFGWLSEDQFDEAKIRNLAKMVYVYEDSALTTIYESTGKMGSEVTVKLEGGDTLSAAVPTASDGLQDTNLGDPILDKFLSLTNPLIGEQAEELGKDILLLDDKSDIGNIVGKMTI